MYSGTSKMIYISWHKTPCNFVNSDPCVAGACLHSVCSWEQQVSQESQQLFINRTSTIRRCETPLPGPPALTPKHNNFASKDSSSS